MFNTPRYYDILTFGQYKMPNSNDGHMQLQAPTTCPKWNKGTDEDVRILQWLSVDTGLTSECISEVIESFTRQWVENTMKGMTWNEAAKCAATKQVMWLPAKVVAPDTASSSSVFEEYTLLDRLTEVEAQLTFTGNVMIVDKPAKPLAGPSKHPDDADIMDSKLIY